MDSWSLTHRTRFDELWGPLPSTGVPTPHVCRLPPSPRIRVTDSPDMRDDPFVIQHPLTLATNNPSHCSHPALCPPFTTDATEERTSDTHERRTYRALRHIPGSTLMGQKQCYRRLETDVS